MRNDFLRSVPGRAQQLPVLMTCALAQKLPFAPADFAGYRKGATLRNWILLVVLTVGTYGTDRAVSAPPNARQSFTVYVAPKAEVTQVVKADETQLTVTATGDLWLQFESTTAGAPSKSWGRQILCRKPATVSISHQQKADTITVLTFSGI